MLLDSGLNYPSFTTALLSTFLIYAAVLVIYRLYFSPLAHIPGPKLWAATFWPEFYHDIIRCGKFSWEISALHKTYGPIVRINPIEVHISDPDYYDAIYAGPSRVTDKYALSTQRFNAPLAIFTTADHYEHRRLRAPVAPFFSKQSIMKFSNDIAVVVSKMLDRLHGFADTGNRCNLHDAYIATSVDIITEYSFCKKKNALEAEDFMPILYQNALRVGEMTRIFFQMPWILPLINLFPTWLVRLTSPGGKFMLDFVSSYERMVEDFMASSTDASKASHPTILHNLLNDPNLRPQDKTVKRVGNEAHNLVQAGFVSTADTLKIATFYILSRPNCLTKVRSELATVPFDPNMPTSVYLTKLEKLPYLSAVISESLRKGYVTPARLQRISRHVPLVYPKPDSTPSTSSNTKGSAAGLHRSEVPAKTQTSYIIPPGTPVSMLTIDMHDNPEKFPEPAKWDPERWLIRTTSTDGEGPESKEEKVAFNSALLHYIVPFSRGTRACLGKELAYAELYLVLARVFDGGNGINLKLCEDLTDERDVTVDHDAFNTAPAKGRGAIWVKVERM